MKIIRILLADIRMPLPKPLRLGPMVITTRDYVAVRVETETGVFGDALGYPRGTPLIETLAQVGQGLLGSDALMRRKGIYDFDLAHPNSQAIYARALSLLDIALWDITAKVAGLPLYRMLGGLRTRIPVTAVAGYHMYTRSIDDISDEVGRRIDEGYPRVKVMLRGDDPEFDLCYIKTVTCRAPGKVAADAHWSWRSLTEALRVCSQIDDLGLVFLEDPFPPQEGALTASLGKALATPIAAGEDVIGSKNMSELAENVSVLRVDATTCGGITGAVSAVQAASFAGCTVLPHVFAPLHLQLACAFSEIEGVEVIPEESGADPLGLLLKRPARVKDGYLTVDENPGAGMELDWPFIEQEVVRSVVLDQATSGMPINL
jgi:L-alanine-DL-glutamate epimerase-like enolase superfamily enzyme